MDSEYIILQRRLDEHSDEFKTYATEQRVMWNRLIKAQQQNTQSITDLTSSTKGIIDAWTAAGGAIVVGTAVGRFAKWVMGLSIIGVAVTWVVDRFN